MSDARKTPPTAPSHVLPGLNRGASLCRPNVRPTAYWQMSLSFTVQISDNSGNKARQPESNDGAFPDSTERSSTSVPKHPPRYNTENAASEVLVVACPCVSNRAISV